MIAVKFTPIADRDAKTATIVKQVSQRERGEGEERERERERERKERAKGNKLVRTRERRGGVGVKITHQSTESTQLHLKKNPSTSSHHPLPSKTHSAVAHYKLSAQRVHTTLVSITEIPSQACLLLLHLAPDTYTLLLQA